MKKIRFKAKIIFLAIFALLLGMCVYEDAVNPTPRCLINIGVLVFMMNAYLEKKEYIKRLKEKTETQEFLLRSFDANSPDIIIYFDKNQRLITCNKTMCNIFGIKNIDEVKNSTVFNYLPKDNARLVYRYNREVLETGKPVKYSLFVEDEIYGEKIYETISVPIKKQEKINGLITICRDVTFREKLRKKYTEKQNQLNSILNNLPMAAFLIDTEGKYISGNNKIEELLNVKESSLLGSEIFAKYFDHSHEELKERISIITREKCSASFEHFYTFPNSNPSWYKIYQSPICDNSGNIKGITVFVQNIGAEKEISRQKEHYIATLSHDLKTPIIAQIRSLELLLKGVFGKVNPEQLELLNLTLDSCKNMYTLVSTILYSYKFDNAEIKLNTENVNIMEMLIDCCDEVSKYAKEKNIEIIVDTSLTKSVIEADSKFLKYAILYLIENSISYAYEKTKLKVDLFEENNEIAFKIQSEGPYISKDNMAVMFDQYLGQTESYNKIGFCLKLYYSSQIIRAHKGQIVVDSDPSNKNTFGFKIPRISKKIPAIA